MFTGIIETTAEVVSTEEMPAGVTRITFRSAIGPELHIDQSLSHDGVCLTVIAADGDDYAIEMVEETRRRTRFGSLQPGDRVNLERAMRTDGRLDGHFVQGHVDTVGTFIRKDSSGYHFFAYPAEYDNLVVEKGSITINGVSLTVAGVKSGELSVALIPYTLEHTNLGDLKAGQTVNLEFDILGKYVEKQLAHHRRD